MSQNNSIYSRKITSSNPAYGAVSSEHCFDISAPGEQASSPNQLRYGQGISIVWNKTECFDFGAIKPSHQHVEGGFYSFFSLARSINFYSKGRLHATINTNDILDIFSIDGSEIQILDLNAPGEWPGMVQVLGFTQPVYEHTMDLAER